VHCRLLFAIIIAFPVGTASRHARAAARAGDPRPNPDWIPLKEFERCGPLSLLVLGELAGREMKLAAIERWCAPSDKGEVSVTSLCDTGAKLGLRLVAVRCESGDLEALQPGIMHLRAEGEHPGHYCVAGSVSGEKVLIVDPPSPNKWVSMTDLQRRWDGVLIVLESRLPKRHTSRDRLPLALFSTASGVAGFALHRGIAHRRRRAGRTSCAVES